MVKLVEGDEMWQLHIEVYSMSAYCMNIEECKNIKVEIDGKPWYHDIKAYIKDGEYSLEAIDSEKKFIRKMVCQFFLSGEVLYDRNHDTTLLWCIDTPEANHLMEEMHEGLLRARASGPLFALKVIIAGYYWLTMESECIKHVSTYHRCQVYQNRKNVIHQPQHSLAVPWPFQLGEWCHQIRDSESLKRAWVYFW